MTNATIALTELAEKGADVDVLRQMVQFMAQRLMDVGADADLSHGRVYSEPVRARRIQAGRSAQLVFHGSVADRHVAQIGIGANTLPDPQQANHFSCTGTSSNVECPARRVVVARLQA